jgi:hypothetical protein
MPRWRDARIGDASLVEQEDGRHDRRARAPVSQPSMC